MYVVATPASNGIAARLARAIKADLVIVESKTFPDGETYVRVPQRLNDTVVVVHSLHPPQDSNFLKLLLVLDAVRGAGAREVVAVVPYLAYARQDKRFLEGEPVSVGVVLKSIEAAGASALVAVDIHAPKSLDQWLTIPHANAMPVPELAEYFKGKLQGDAIVLAPDAGALERAKLAASVLGVDYDYIEKRRDRVTGEVQALPKSLDVMDKTVLIVDDIISTGGTIALASKSALENGAREVYAACTHALLVSGALDKIYAAGVSDVVATDTVPSPVSKVSAVRSVIRALKEIGFIE